ncbi:MAG: ThiF family adenylyltransferase [Myxococcota bacterium]
MQTPRIAALLGSFPALGPSDRLHVRGTLRDRDDVLQVHLDEAHPLGNVVVTDDATPPDVNVPFAVAGGVAWVRRSEGWVALPTIGTAAGVLARNAGVLESSLLADASVAVIGLGSGGAIIADQLARAGVGRLVLVDRDRIEVENVGRHLCDLTDLGRRKTAAVADRVRSRNPALRVDTFDLDVLEEPDALRAAVEGCAVLIGATDGNASRRVVNRLAVETGRPAIFGRAYTRASGGDVARVAPGGPCYDCLYAGFVADEEVASSRSAGAPAYADTPVLAEPGLALDILPIALMCARLAVQELVRGRGSSLESLDEDFPGALFLWANRREGQFAEWAPMRFGHRGFAVHRWYGLSAPRNPRCPTCNEDAFLATLLESEGVCDPQSPS